MDSSTAPFNIDTLIRSIAVQSLLHIGSRSFSHLLNAIERYLPLLRHLAGASPAGTSAVPGSTAAGSSSGNTEARMEILSAAAAFWKHNRQMVIIVFDKLMQYQIVDPTDIVSWTFLNGSAVGQLLPNSSSSSASGEDGEGTAPMSLSAFEWDLLKAAIDKANGRVVSARRKVMGLRKEADEKRARAKARADNDTTTNGTSTNEGEPGANGMEVDDVVGAETKEGSWFLLPSLHQSNWNADHGDKCRRDGRRPATRHCSEGVLESDKRTTDGAIQDPRGLCGESRARAYRASSEPSRTERRHARGLGGEGVVGAR